MKIFRLFRAMRILSVTMVCLLVPVKPSRGSETTKSTENKKPNIVLVFCDDLGFGDLGCYGNPKIRTPHLDKMASQGMLFTNFTVASPVCSPSRAGLMTGQFPSRLRFHGHLASLANNQQRGMPNFLDPDAITLTKMLQSAGYVTGHFGKWHMGGPQDKTAPAPEQYGIDVSATVLSNGQGYNEKGDKRANSSFRIMQHTIDFIEANADQPFFVNCWLIDPHSVLAPSAEQLDDYPELQSMAKAYTSATQVYSAVVSDIDRQVGRLMEKLEELGVADNTLVVR